MIIAMHIYLLKELYQMQALKLQIQPQIMKI